MGDKLPMSEVQPTEIETGVKLRNDTGVDFSLIRVDPEVFAFADDGEYSVVWAIESVSKREIKIAKVFCESGRCELANHRPQLDTVPSLKSSAEVGRDLAQSDPETEIAKAIDHFEQ